MSLTLITPPAAEPVALGDVKTYLKIDASDEDALLTSLITAARARAEWHTGRAFVTQSWLFQSDIFPQSRIVELPLPPLQSVTSVAITSRDGIRSVQSPSRYTVDTSRVIFSDTPQSLARTNAFEIAFTAGYGDASAVPAGIKTAILQIVGDLYAHRGEEEIVTKAGQAMLAPYRVFKL